MTKFVLAIFEIHTTNRHTSKVRLCHKIENVLNTLCRLLPINIKPLCREMLWMSFKTTAQTRMSNRVSGSRFVCPSLVLYMSVEKEIRLVIWRLDRKI